MELHSPRRLTHIATQTLATMLDGAPPEGLGGTPMELVFKHRKLQLHHVLPAPGTSPGPTLLVIPPLMVRPYIYDLLPNHSLLATLRDAGYDVYLVDFGVPDRGDARLRLDNYVLDFVPSCINETLRHSGTQRLGLVGYCMGGLFALIHVGTHRDPRVEAVVAIASPVNFRELGLLTRAARISAPVMDTVVDLLGNVPGVISSSVFKLLSAPKIIKSHLDLLRHVDDRGHVQSFRAINYWINDMIPYPREAYRQMYHEVLLHNRLYKGQLRFDGHPCDLSQITCPLLAFAGEQDAVARPAAVREVLDLVGTADKELHVVPGGHVGVVAGSSAPELVWAPTVSWLHQRLGQDRADAAEVGG